MKDNVVQVILIRISIVTMNLRFLASEKNITKQDLMLFAQRQDIRNASSIIEEVEDVVMNFKSYAEKVEIDEHWIRKIERVLEEIRK